MAYFLVLAAILIVGGVLAFFKKLLRILLILATAVLAVLWTVFNSITQVEFGTVKVASAFGAMQPVYYEAGLRGVMPWYELKTMNIQRRSQDFTNGNFLGGVSSDRVAMEAEITQPFIVNPAMSWKLAERYGTDTDNWSLLSPAIQESTRICISSLTWQYGLSDAGRTELVQCITTKTDQKVQADLMKAGFTEAEARSAFTYPAIALRRFDVADERVRTAVAEKEAAREDLERQQTLTAIAMEEANRRAQEGTGIRRMMDELPKDYSISEMVAVVGATAAKLNAEAFMKAVENGNPNITVVVEGSPDANTAVPVGGTPNRTTAE